MSDRNNFMKNLKVLLEQFGGFNNNQYVGHHRLKIIQQ